jgi:hypothetical protein
VGPLESSTKQRYSGLLSLMSFSSMRQRMYTALVGRPDEVVRFLMA